MESLLDRVHRYICDYALIAPHDTVVVAVSGGADSLCLFHLLHTLSAALDCHLVVAHLDHGLRPDSSDDAAFVVATAATLGWPCLTDRCDVQALARRRRLSLEAAARDARYAFLAEVAQASGASAIAVGHTGNDQAETLLLQLARGTGLPGLTGMQPRRGQIVRPLLEVTRQETVTYCATQGLTPRQDPSNDDRRYRRNRVRHDLLPLLDQVHPGATHNLMRTARHLTGDRQFIEGLARQALDTVSRSLNAERGGGATDSVTARVAGTVCLSAEAWRACAAELHPYMWRLLLGDLLGSADGFDERHYHALTRALDADADAATIDLPHGLRLERHGDRVRLGQRTNEPGPLATQRLAVPGAIDTGEGTLTAEVTRAPLTWQGLSPWVAYLNPEGVGSQLTVRAWQAGDRLQPLGLDGRRKVQDLFVDRKVPRARRQRIPIVVGRLGIAWVGGVCVADPYRVDNAAAAIRVTWERAPNDRQERVAEYSQPSGDHTNSSQPELEGLLY